MYLCRHRPKAIDCCTSSRQTPRIRRHAEKVEDRAKDQIEYPNEDPYIRQKFEEELGKRGIKSIMPAECYTNPDYEWSKAMGKQ